MMRHHFLWLLQSLSIGLLSCSAGMFLPIDQNALADGRLLRGERWQRWRLDDSSKADFYVASDGNDSWSGTLAVPNRQQTDGPFATLDKARVAVRKLKKSIYQKKRADRETVDRNTALFWHRPRYPGARPNRHLSTE